MTGDLRLIPTLPCPQCTYAATFSKKRGRYYCAECELEFDAPARAVEPQSIFLSYAHRSEREEDFDVSEELVLLIQQELQRDGHTVWIDKDGIRAGSQWRERITAAILEHAHFLSFLSTRSVRDPGVCLNEIATALDASKNIQTLLAQDEHRVAPPLTISHIQWHDFQHWREIRAGTKTGPMGEDWEAWFGQRMAGLRETLTSAQSARVNGELQKLREILDPRSFEARIAKMTANFHGRTWLFDAAREWLDKSTSRTFWLKGGPGVGKSAFAARLAHQARSAVIGFFMCDFQGRKDPEESAREAICTLAFQIASRLPDYRLKLLYQIHLDKEKVDKRSADDLFEFLITEPLNRSGKIPESTRLCLVIDALDEAGRSGGGNALAELLAKHAERLPEWLGVLVTSRPEPYLEQILKPLSGVAVDAQSPQNRADLADWIGARLPEGLQGEERLRVIEAVLEKSGGTFLYLSLIAQDNTLNLADANSLPDQLDGFFKKTFDRYFPDPEQYGKKTEAFLRLIVAAPGPLPAEMGRQILGWGQRELTLNVIEPMGSLLQGRDGGLVFFHASLVDWLKDPKRSGPFCVETDGARILAEFLWGEFLVASGSIWKQELASWLTLLLPQTLHWSCCDDVAALCAYLDEDSQFRAALELGERHLELLKQRQPKAHPQEVSKALYRIGLINGKLFRPAASRRLLLQAIELVDGADLLFLCDLHEAIGVTYKAEAQLRRATEAFERSLELKTATASVPLWSRARTLGLLGDVTDAIGDFRGACSRLQEALSLHASSGGTSLANPNGAALLNSLAIVMLRLHSGLVFGRDNPFISRSREFVAVARMLSMAQRLVDTGGSFAPRPDFLAYTNNLAITLHSMGEPGRALDLLNDLVEKFLIFRGEKHPDLAIVLNNMGAILDTTGDSRESRRIYERAIKIFESGGGAEHPHLARCLNNFGALLFSERHFDDAKQRLTDAYRILHRVLGDQHVDTAQCASNLAVIDFVQGRIGLAVDRLEGVLSVRDRELGSAHPQTCSTRIILAKGLLAKGEVQAGEEMTSAGLCWLVKVLGSSHPAITEIVNRHGDFGATSLLNDARQIDEESISTLEALLDQLEGARWQASGVAPSSTGADGSYRIQLEVVDVLFSHRLLR